MALATGTSLGPYRIETAIGEGGMGQVYKATDTRLNRTVALKVLPDHFAGDPDMRGRFEREAQTIAGLNHPHICTLHDVGHLRPEGASADQGEIHFLVMEYVEGETLADRLQRGPLAVDDALRVASEIVAALDRAHRQGIVHRDLKPANIMLAGSTTTRSGQTVRASGKQTTKLLDFGLAKWASDRPAPIETQPTRLDVTAQGTMIGTLQYMAPEQVEGREADPRTDIFAFGAVLYEMLTGKRAFEGKSQASLIGAIMKAEPRPISHVQPLTPASIEHLVSRCLVKDPEERWQNAHTLKRKLEWIARTRGTATATVEAPKRRWLDVAVTAGILVVLAAVSVPAYLYWRGPADPEPIQFRHTISGLMESDFAVSPDGKTFAFVAKPDSSGASSLYTRPVKGLVAVKLAGTDGASQPFWSPDNQFVAYISAGKLRKVPASGGAPKDVCEAREFSGGAWSAAQGGTILFGSSKGLLAVSAEGGQPTPVTELSQGETGHFWPAFLPDGRHFVYLAWSDKAESRALFTGTLDSKERSRLMAAESNAVYAAPGLSRTAAPAYLFFHRKATLFAQPFDANAMRFTGDPMQVAGEVAHGAEGFANFTVSQNGVLMYLQGTGGAGITGRGRTTQSQWNWTLRKDGKNGTAIDPGPYGDMDLSPDGKLIAITKQDPGSPTSDVWVIDWEKSVSHRLTSDPASALDPVWSPQGDRIAFTSYRKGNADIYVKNANGVGAETPLAESSMNESVEDWSRDGKYILFEYGKDAFQDIYALPLDGLKPGKPFPVVAGQYQKNEPQFSKDGKWVAYVSDENVPSRFEVYVVSFPSGTLKQQISTDGGGQPRWSWDGKQLHYRTLNNSFMTVDLKLGATIEHSAPRPFTMATTINPTAGDPTRHMWSIASDGSIVRRVPLGQGGAGGGAAAPNLPAQFAPSGQGAAAAAARGNVTSALTAILHWSSALQKVEK